MSRALARLLVAILALVAGVAFGAEAAEAQNGVAAINVETSAAVGADSRVAAGHVGSDTGLFDDGVSGCCVAPRSAPRVHGAPGTEPVAGQRLYRVYGGDSAAGGASWSPVDPRTVSDFRNAAGLPSGGASGATNTGQFVLEGILNDPAAVVLQRNALPLDGMKGGIPEYIIPNWVDNGSIALNRQSGVLT